MLAIAGFGADVRDVPVWIYYYKDRLPGVLHADGEITSETTYTGANWDDIKKKMPSYIASAVEDWGKRAAGSIAAPIGFIAAIGINGMRYSAFKKETYPFDHYVSTWSGPGSNWQKVVVSISKPEKTWFDSITSLVSDVHQLACTYAPVGAAMAGRPDVAAATAAGCKIVSAATTPGGSAPISNVRVEPQTQIAPAATSTPAARYAGAIYAYDPSIQKYRVARPSGLSGLAAAYSETEQLTTRPPGGTAVTLPDYQKKTGTAPWYKRPSTYVAASAVAAAAGGAVYFLKFRR